MEDKNHVEISIILPCKNEEQSLTDCILKTQKVLKEHNINGEIIVSDSSTDSSPKIARELKVKLVKHDKEGYGNACIEGFKIAEGKYLFFADPDNTYDFKEIPRFLKYLRNNYDFVIGNRFKGNIEKGAMPLLHRYIGSPFFFFILRVFFGVEISDVHCGMRALKKQSLDRLNLQTTGMEFASEMVVKAVKNKLTIKELPINYYKRKGDSKLKTFRDGWRHLKFILFYRQNQSDSSHVCFYITNKCNLGCKWCLRNNRQGEDFQAKDMDFSTFKRILKKCPHARSIGFAGQGEPLLNKDIFKMISHAYKKELKVYINSNFTSLDNKNLEKLMRDNIDLNISIKGINLKEFVKNTQSDKDLFNNQIENIRQFILEKNRQKSKASLTISYVVSDDNYKTMEDVIKLAKKLEADKILFDNFIPFNDFKQGKGCLFEDNNEIKNHINYLKNKYRNLIIEFPILIKKDNFSYHLTCHRVLSVDANGNISNCMRAVVPNSKHGNIFKGENFMNINKELPSRCRFCVEMSRGS